MKFEDLKSIYSCKTETKMNIENLEKNFPKPSVRFEYFSAFTIVGFAFLSWYLYKINPFMSGVFYMGSLNISYLLVRSISSRKLLEKNIQSYKKYLEDSESKKYKGHK